jgi:hypothetical protein
MGEKNQKPTGVENIIEVVCEEERKKKKEKDEEFCMCFILFVF